MATLKYNPYDLLQKEGIVKKMLSEEALHSLELFDKAAVLFEKRPTSKEFQNQAEKAGRITSEVIAKDIDRIKGEVKNDVETREKTEIKKAQSRKIIEKSEHVLDDLALCRQRLKEDRQRKIESGEITKPKKKNLTTKLREDLSKIINLIPKDLKEDKDVITRTEKAVLKFLNELKEIWGINKIKPIQDELAEKFKQLHEQAA